MKKTFLTIFGTLSVLLCFSQKYYKLKESITRTNVRLYKDEIFLSVKSASNQKESITLQFGSDTINIPLKKCTEVTIPKENKYTLKDSLVKLTISDSLVISSKKNKTTSLKIATKDTFIAITTGNKTPFVIARTSVGIPFRLIIPNSPSLLYYESDIQALAEQQNKPEITTGDTAINGETINAGTGEKKPENKPIPWKKIAIIAIFLLLVTAAYLLISHYRKKSLSMNSQTPNEAKYTGGKIKKFLHKHNLTISELIKLNPAKFPWNYEQLSEKEKNDVRGELEGEFLVVKKSELQNTGDPPFNQGIGTGPTENTGSLIQAIARMETRILEKISSSSSDKISAENQKKLIQEKETLETKLNELKQNTQELSNKNLSLENQLTSVQETLNSTNNNLKKYTDRLLFAEYLENYAKVASAHFDLLKSTLDKAGESMRKLSVLSQKDSILFGLLLTKCYLAIPPRTGNWEEIVQGVVENKTISNTGIIRSFNQLSSNEEKISYFQKLILREVLEKYTGTVLLLAEELRNFSHFSGDGAGFIKEIELTFSPLCTEIVNKAKTVGLEVNYVPLFVNAGPYAKITRSVSEKHQLPYNNIRMERDFIAEIITYGFGNNPTTIITA